MVKQEFDSTVREGQEGVRANSKRAWGNRGRGREGVREGFLEEEPSALDLKGNG